MSELWQRIKAARISVDLSQQEVADACGISRSAVAQWEAKDPSKRTSPSTENLRELSKITGAPMDWLLSDESDLAAEWMRKIEEDQAEASHEPVMEGYALIHCYTAKGACGLGKHNDHIEVCGKLAFRKDWLVEIGVSPDKASIIYAEGESMAPTIHDGEVLLIDHRKSEPKAGLVFAIQADHEVWIKRLFRSVAGDWRLVSDNPDKTRYPDEPLTESMNALIIGQVVWRAGRVH